MLNIFRNQRGGPAADPAAPERPVLATLAELRDLRARIAALDEPDRAAAARYKEIYPLIARREALEGKLRKLEISSGKEFGNRYVEARAIEREIAAIEGLAAAEEELRQIDAGRQERQRERETLSNRTFILRQQASEQLAAEAAQEDAVTSDAVTSATATVQQQTDERFAAARADRDALSAEIRSGP